MSGPRPRPLSQSSEGETDPREVATIALAQSVAGRRIDGAGCSMHPSLNPKRGVASAASRGEGRHPTSTDATI